MSLGRGPLPLIIYDEGVSSASHFAAEFIYMIGMSTKRRRQWRLRNDRHPLPRGVARRDLRMNYMTRLDFGLMKSCVYESLLPCQSEDRRFHSRRIFIFSRL